MTPFARAALDIAAMGMRVFPCRIESKSPLINKWQLRATLDTPTILGWWDVRPSWSKSFNIAIATGKDSNCWALDVDGDEGEETLRKLETKHGALPETLSVITGDNGRHLYFRWPGIEIRNSQIRDDIPGLDVRGEGGYCLAPPSIHDITKREYKWGDKFTELADAPPWLIDIVTLKRSMSPIPVNWQSFVGETFNASHRGSAVAKLCGMLLRRFVEPAVVLDLLRLFNAQRCDPPLDDAEVRNIFTKIPRKAR
jgi:putative DNA primase/helicase